MDFTAATRRYRQAKRAKGLCGYSGCKTESLEAYFCPVHAAKNNAAAAKYRESVRGDTFLDKFERKAAAGG